tara:strand:- start:200 stop:529 length:330 start_codon:yes stop_codon:yes gene_type:complete
MRNINKLTRPQIQSMLTHIGGLNGRNEGRKKDLKMFYHPLTPKDVYVKYTSFGLEPDNSIYSEIVVKCIKSDGKSEDCIKQFDNLKQRMGFESDFLEIDLDGNGNLIFV